MSVVLLRGDARELPLADASVDLIVTSPPYWSLRDYRDGGGSLAGQIGSEKTPQGYIAALLDCTREWVRVLRPGGSIFVNIADKYAGGGQGGNVGGRLTGGLHLNRTPAAARIVPPGFRAKSLMALPERYAIGCVDALGLILRRDNIWHKSVALPENVDDRCATRHEYVFHLTREPHYYSAVDEVREPHASASLTSARRARVDANPLGKVPGSVWEFGTQPLLVPAALSLDHHAAFPMELPRRCILGWSPPGGVVLDPFGGTGTTALVGDVLGRIGISVDRSADYCRLARWRTTDPGERAKAFQVPKPPPVPDGQQSLFGGAA